MEMYYIAGTFTRVLLCEYLPCCTAIFYLFVCEQSRSP